VNQTLVERCGARSKDELIGRTTAEIFPSARGESYLRQDMSVCHSRQPIVGRLELHLYPGGAEGWCLTDKVPITSAEGEILGLAGVSRDLRRPRNADRDLDELAETITWIEEHLDGPLRVEELATRTKLSEYQLGRRIRSIFGITTSQLITKTRIDAASRLLRESEKPIGDIALTCGYCDQSAFTRQFKRTVGLTPSQYREGRNTG